MRYQEVCDALEKMSAVMSACSREWKLSPSTVMCLEVNVFSALRPATLPDHSDTDVGTYRRNIRVMFFDGQGRQKEYGDLTALDMRQASEYQAMIQQWLLDKENLPPSTSSVVAESLRQRARR